MAPKSPRLQAELDRMGRERLIEGREADRDVRRELVRVCLECIASCAVGLLCMGYALHTTDEAVGRIFWNAGIVIDITGVAMSCLLAYRRGEERGDW